MKIVSDPQSSMKAKVDSSLRREAFSAFLLLLLILLFDLPSFENDARERDPKPASSIENPDENSRKAAVVKRVSFVAVGDIMLSRGVAREILREANPALPFSQIADILRNTDFNFGNLESPVSGNNLVTGRGLVFNTDSRHLAGLRDFNFKIVSLANNHALDQGLKGLVATRSFLGQYGIKYVGAGEDQVQAWQSEVIEANGVRIGFIGASYTSINDGGASTNPFVARVEELERLLSALKELRERADFVVVTMHAGTEYVRKPHPSQVAFARAAIDAGADIVIGSHPHWIQTFENYRGKYIFYSLGNFIFDQRRPDTKEGLVLRLTVRRDRPEPAAGVATLERIELIPVVTDRPGVPRPAGGERSKEILAKIGAKTAVIEP